MSVRKPNPRSESWASAAAGFCCGGGGNSPGGEDGEAGGSLKRLLGAPLPTVELPFALEGTTSLAALARRRSLAVFFHHDDLTRVRPWAEHEDQLEGLGCMPVSVSAQPPEAQLRLAGRALLGYMLLSDPQLQLARALDLPTLSIAEEHIYEPLTLLAQGERITQILYPVDPDREIAWALQPPHRQRRGRCPRKLSNPPPTLPHPRKSFRDPPTFPRRITESPVKRRDRQMTGNVLAPLPTCGASTISRS